MTVRGGPNGYSDFIRDIQHIFGITAEHDMQLAFDCADPITGAGFRVSGVRVQGLCAGPGGGPGGRTMHTLSTRSSASECISSNGSPRSMHDTAGGGACAAQR